MASKVYCADGAVVRVRTGPVRPARDVSHVPMLPAHLAEFGAVPQWALADSHKVAVRFDGRRPWGGPTSGDHQAVVEAVRQGKRAPFGVLGTYDEARAALARRYGDVVPLKGRTDLPVVDGLSFRFLPTGHWRVVGLDLDGVIDARGRVHPAAVAILDQWRTWVEVSVSGRGLHAYGWADVDEELPDGAVAHPLPDGGPDFDAWPDKPPSAAVYDGRSWRHFRFSGVPFGPWGHRYGVESVQWAVNALLKEWRDEARRARSRYRSAERVEDGPRRPAGVRSVRLDTLTGVSLEAVARRLGADESGDGYLAVCPRCKASGRVSKDRDYLRPSLVLRGKRRGVWASCGYCKDRGFERDCIESLKRAVAR